MWKPICGSMEPRCTTAVSLVPNSRSLASSFSSTKGGVPIGQPAMTSPSRLGRRACGPSRYFWSGSGAPGGRSRPPLSLRKMPRRLESRSTSSRRWTSLEYVFCQLPSEGGGQKTGKSSVSAYMIISGKVLCTCLYTGSRAMSKPREPITQPMRTPFLPAIMR